MYEVLFSTTRWSETNRAARYSALRDCLHFSTYKTVETEEKRKKTRDLHQSLVGQSRDGTIWYGSIGKAWYST